MEVEVGTLVHDYPIRLLRQHDAVGRLDGLPRVGSKVAYSVRFCERADDGTLIPVRR
jgi:hypothetical protein